MIQISQVTETSIDRDALSHRYQQQGYAVAAGLFSADEVATLAAHFEQMRLQQREDVIETLSDEAQIAADDPLLAYPRLMQPHRFDDHSRCWLLDARLNQSLTALMGREPYAVQTMVYFKPPGARGQALHQDQYFLRVQPGTCMAVWLALDDVDSDNGCMRVVPQSHTWDLLCTVDADTRQSFTDITVGLPDGVEAVDVHMRAGDVLFFNGQLVHGSLPNSTTDRFRRSLIGHYITGDAQQVAQYYHPVLRMDGSELTIGTSEYGSQCGTWVQRDGQAELVMHQQAP